MVETYEQKVARQVALEKESVELGITRYHHEIEGKELSDLPPGLQLMKLALEPLEAAIEEFKRPSRGGGRLVSTRAFLNQFETEVLAYITARVCMNCIASSMPAQKAAISVANMLLDQLEYDKFKKENPGYLFVMESNMRTKNTKHRRTAIMMAKRRLGIEDTEWTEQDKLHIGVKLIDLFIQATGLVERVRQYDYMALEGTQKAWEWVEKAHSRCELLAPVFLPMLVKPRPWTNPLDGGFLCTTGAFILKMVKTRNKSVIEDLANREMPQVYRALNGIQDTPWRINRKVYDVLRTVWNEGSCLGHLPPADDMPMPPTPWKTDEEFGILKETQPDVVKEWKHKATAVHQRNHSNRGKRLNVIQKLWVAEKFLAEEEIFFVWTLDWRGRIYPVQTHVNPQADDTGKALLEFSEGKPLGERGAWWLAVHIANEFGFDKASFDERVAWVKAHQEEILDSARNPLDGARFWCEADHPYRFLAACFEWEGYVREGAAYVSHIPVGLDGTCNGLQNFSAMLRDEVGGRAVNLVPADRPQDVYAQVAKVVSAKVERDAAAGDEMAKLWVGKIDRGIAKRNVMTTPYGAKKYGMKDQLMEELKKRSEAAGTPYLDCEDTFEPARYLANVMWEGIGEVVIAARHAMEWLQETARIASQSGYPIRWTTPAGFLVHQAYPKQKLRQIETFWGGVRVVLGLLDDLPGIDSRKQANGISPNFVHSMDASHLMLTVNRLQDIGIRSFSLVHDSYGTHAADTEALAANLRDGFIEQYSRDVLAIFAEEIKSQLPQELAEKIPPLPAKGKLDLYAVRQSKYFFA